VARSSQAGSRLKLISALVVVAVAVAAIYYGWRSSFSLSTEQAAALVRAKNLGLAQLENQKVADALETFQPMLARVPRDPLPVQNVAVARVLALGDEGSKPGQQELQAAASALEELRRRDGATLSYRWLALRYATAAGDDAAAQEHLAAILTEEPGDAAAWYARYRLMQQQGDSASAREGYDALSEACRLQPTNAWLRVEWLRATAALLAADKKTTAADLRLSDQLALARQAVTPFAHVIKTFARADVLDLLDKAEQAATADDRQAVSRSLVPLANLLLPHASPDQRTVRRHPLEFVADDFQPEFYTSSRLPPVAAPTAIDVQFRPIALPEELQQQASDIRDARWADFDLDGRLDLIILSSSQVSVWSRNAESVWQQIATAPVEQMEHLLAVDVDSDFDETHQAVRPGQGSAALKNGCPSADVDVAVYGTGGVVFLENRFDKTTRERSLAAVDRAKQPELAGPVVAISAAELDGDGDLDLVLATDAGVRLWANTSEWSFSNLTSRSMLPTAALGEAQLVAVDLDRDVDVDVLVASSMGGGWLENVRHGQFRWRPFAESLEPLAKSPAVAVADVDGNASWDLIFASDAGLTLATTRTPASGVWQVAATQSLAGEAAARVIAWDYDNDGFDDLLVRRGAEASLLRGLGQRQFAAPIKLPAGSAGDTYEPGDLDGDGDLDLLIASKGGMQLLENVGGNKNHWLDVALQAQQIKGQQHTPSGRVSPFGVGCLVELKAGQQYQARVVAGQTTHFGLGQASAADAVRVVWLNGVPQNVLQPAADLFVCEQQVLNTSCPYLYTDAGDRFVFATDLLWNAPLGLQLAEGVLAPPRDWEYLKIDGQQLRERDGEYVLQLTEELWEAAYFDQVRLIAIDHPEDVSIYSNEKVGPASLSEFKVHTVRHRLGIVSAINHVGRDLLPDLAEADGRYAQVHERKLRQGVTEPTYLELQLGPEVRGARRVTLFLTGWLRPSSTSLNVAMSQGGSVPPPTAPSLSVADEAGNWRTLMPFMGFPGGKTKTIAIELGDALSQTNGRLRIATSMEFYWDHIFYAVDEPPTEVKTIDLPLVAADLHHRGYSEVVVDAGHGPEHFHYDRVTTSAKWPAMEGSFTPYGNVRPLLTERDDRLLVIGAGDEVTLRFEAGNPPPAGWRRDFFFYSAGWEKDCNLLTVLGESVDPLPYEAMPGYPWPADAKSPPGRGPLPGREQSVEFWKSILRYER
jgi:hypothetical protein